VSDTPETIAEGFTRRKRTLGRNVERLMDARRMSYTDMAKAARMSRTGVFKIVDGTSNASMESLFAIADFFGVTLNDLFTSAPSGED